MTTGLRKVWEWPACYGRSGYDLPRPILIFVAAKENGFACCGRRGNDPPRPILFFVAEKENGPPAENPPPMHRFLISGLDLRIDASFSPFSPSFVHRFLISGLVSVSAITCPRYKKSRVCALLFFSPFVWEEVPVCFGFGSGRHGGRSVEYIRQVVEEVDAHLTA